MAATRRWPCDANSSASVFEHVRVDQPDGTDPRIAVHPLQELPARRLIAVWHRERTLGSAARAFVHAAAEACSRHQPFRVG